MPLMTTAPAAPDPSRRPQPMELFPGHDMGKPHEGWKPVRREPLGTTRSGTRLITPEEREQILRKASMTVPEAASVIGVSQVTVRNYLADGSLEGTVINRDLTSSETHTRIHTESVRRFLAERSTSARAGQRHP